MDTYKINFINRFITLCFDYCPDISNEVAEFIACQFALESNFGRSALAIDNDNYCGMKIPSNRVCNGWIIEDNPHPDYLIYNSAEDCVIDYFYRCAWFRYDKRSFKDIELFKLELRNSGYCPEKSYISRIESIYNQFINY